MLDFVYVCAYVYLWAFVCVCMCVYVCVHVHVFYKSACFSLVKRLILWWPKLSVNMFVIIIINFD